MYNLLFTKNRKEKLVIKLAEKDKTTRYYKGGIDVHEAWS